MTEILTVSEVCTELDELIERGVIDSYDQTAVERSLDASWVNESLDEGTNRAIAVFSYLIEQDRVVAYDPETISGHASYEDLIEQYAAAADGYLDGWAAEMEGVVFEEDIDITLSVDGETVERTMETYRDWADTETLTGLLNEALDAVGAPGQFYVFSDVPAEFAALYLRPEQVRPAVGYFIRLMTDWTDEQVFDPTPGTTAACAVCDDPVDLGEAWPTWRVPHRGQPVHPECYRDTESTYPTNATDLA